VLRDAREAHRHNRHSEVLAMGVDRDDRFNRVYSTLTAAGAGATVWLARHSIDLLRLSLGAVFLGFGVLKFVPGLSPAAEIAGRTFSKLTLGIVAPNAGVYVVGAMETAIGLSLLTGRLLRLGLALLGLAMVGILSPLVLLPETLFRGALWAPTLAGQYVLKDVVLLAAALAVASGAPWGGPTSDPPPRRPGRVPGGHPAPAGWRPGAPPGDTARRPAGRHRPPALNRSTGLWWASPVWEGPPLGQGSSGGGPRFPSGR
jgi:hypothetical protein